MKGPAIALPSSVLLVLAAVAPCYAATAPAALNPAVAKAIDSAVETEMQRTGMPAVSIAVVRDNRLIYAHAYGKSRLNPEMPATVEQRFSIGSVTKQFIAAAVLLLQEDGKLRLNQPVARWVPGLTAGDRITIRNVLSHTSGYRDFWPQDYVPTAMEVRTTADEILAKWAKVPLDFQPGEEWQYSNTGFVLAARIVERAAGEPLDSFLRRRIFAPLGMESVTEVDSGPLPERDPLGYTRNALGPTRTAIKEGPGWLLGAGHLAMTPTDLAKWDLAMINEKILQPRSWHEMMTSTRLNNGMDTEYGLGVHAGSDGALRLVSHGGAISGFLAANSVWPDARAAVVVLVNGDYGDPDAIVDKINEVLPLGAMPAPEDIAAARAMLSDLQAGRLNEALLTENAAAYFSETVQRDYKESLAALGPVESFIPKSRRARGGFMTEVYDASFAKQKIKIIASRDGRLYEQFAVYPE